jgi:hypothetical protein
MSEWWECLYGPAVPEYVTITSSPDQTDIPVRLEVDVPAGTHSVPLEMRRVKAGKNGFTLTNEHQRVPTNVSLIARREGEGVRLNLHLGVRHTSKLAALEKKYDAQFLVVFDAIRELMSPQVKVKTLLTATSRRILPTCQ